MLRFTDNLIVQMTRDCNLRCKYCYEGHDIQKWGHAHIDHEQFKQILDTALYYRCILGRIENHLDVHFHGGEVTLIPWEELKKDIEYLLLRKTVFPNLTWCIQSNGTNITDDMAKFFSQRNETFGLSFDGFSSTSRMSSLSSETFIDRLKYFNDKYGLRYAVLSVLTTENIKTWFDDMKKYTFMFDSVGANVLDPPSGMEDLVPSSEEQWEYYFKPVLDTFMTNNPLKERELLILVQEVVEKIVFGLPSFGKTGCFNKLCGHGSNMTSLTPDLHVVACDKFLEEGQFKDKIPTSELTTPDFLGLQQIKNTTHFYKKMFKLFDDMNCENCPAHFICAGECQAFNISKYGEPRLSNNRCDLINQIYQYIKDNWYLMLQNISVKLSIPFDDMEVTPFAREILRKNNLKLNYDVISGYISVVKNEENK